ncbi:MAG TPA: DUF3455 domain-containing protein [Blastocatellia bacterium]|nr:DUF3455 domain-containing protein [Blastocatellia bacterium]
MRSIKTKFVAILVLLLALSGIVLGNAPVAFVDLDDFKSTPPPAACTEIQVPEGNRVSFHVFAIGVQIYKWNGVTWDFVGPMATLFSDAGYTDEVGIHYAGPTWQSTSGGKVVASRVAGCSPDPTAIPWLLLRSVSNSGAGIFRSVTYIQRVNTTGGLSPATPGSAIGDIMQVPYTAEYYFYRAEA